MIDFHCHLDLYPRPHEIAAACADKGIYVLSVTTTPLAWRGTASLAEGRNRIDTALGLHPQLALERWSELEQFDALLSETRFVGEVGLDGAPEFRHSVEKQQSVFTHVLSSCEGAGGRIMSIHSRRASGPVLDLLARHQGAGPAVLHWFSGSVSDLKRAIDLGCWFSVGLPMVTGARGRELISRMPRDRILTESDGPFVQERGAAVMPWSVDVTATMLAGIWRIVPAEAEHVVQENFSRLIGRSEA
jgi:TatD DNase family protein